LRENKKDFAEELVAYVYEPARTHKLAEALN
jgi:hypothetical protein